MKIRPITPQDLDWLKSISSKDNELPDFRHVITEGVIESESGRRLGFGLARLFTEAVIALDPNLSNFQKSKAILTLFQAAIDDCKNAGLDELNAFVEDKNYAELLVKHLGFKVYTGIPLSKEL